MNEHDKDDETPQGNVVNIPISALLQWIPIWLAFIGMFLSAANVYANVMTRMATLETRLNLYAEVLDDVKDELGAVDRQSLRTRQEQADREQRARDDSGIDDKIETNTRKTEENTRDE